MFEQNKSLGWIVGLVAGLLIGSIATYLLKPAPDPDIQWTLGKGLTVNGKAVDLDKLKAKLPNIFGPDKDKGGKKKPGELPAGDLGPAANNVYYNIDPKDVIKNKVGIDGAGVNVPCCLETIAKYHGYKEVEGFADFTTKRTGGHYPKKTIEQFEDFKAGKTVMVDLVIVETDKVKSEMLRSMLDDNGPMMVAYLGKVPYHFGTREVCVGVVLNGFRSSKDGDEFTMVEMNFPNELISMPSDQLAKGCMWVAYFVPTKKAETACPCGPSCTCNPCHCHAAKSISFAPSEDDTVTPVVGQRGGSPKSPELFGIESLVSILREFKEAIFGTDKQAGLKKDIATGLAEWSGTFKSAAWWTAGIVGAWMAWMGLSSQRTADALQRLANKA